MGKWKGTDIYWDGTNCPPLELREPRSSPTSGQRSPWGRVIFSGVSLENQRASRSLDDMEKGAHQVNVDFAFGELSQLVLSAISKIVYPPPPPPRKLATWNEVPYKVVIKAVSEGATRGILSSWSVERTGKGHPSIKQRGLIDKYNLKGIICDGHNDQSQMRRYCRLQALSADPAKSNVAVVEERIPGGGQPIQNFFRTTRWFHINIRPGITRRRIGRREWAGKHWYQRKYASFDVQSPYRSIMCFCIIGAFLPQFCYAR